MNEPFLLSNLIDLQEIDNEIYKIESQKADGEDVVHLKELEIKFKESSKLLELAKNKLSDYCTQVEKDELDTKNIKQKMENEIDFTYHLLFFVCLLRCSRMVHIPVYKFCLRATFSGLRSQGPRV